MYDGEHQLHGVFEGLLGIRAAILVESIHVHPVALRDRFVAETIAPYSGGCWDTEAYSPNPGSTSNVDSEGYLISELWAFMRVRKKWWLLPIMLVMMLVGSLMVFAQGSVLAPFIYTLF